MAQNRHFDVQTLTMAMLRKIGRLFQIKTRFEAWVVTYAIAVGAVERGQHYLAQYPGFSGWLLAAACTAVVFLAGAKLLDSVTPSPKLAAAPYRPAARRMFSGNRPTTGRPQYDSESRPWLRTDSRRAKRPGARRAGSPGDRTHTPRH